MLNKKNYRGVKSFVRLCAKRAELVNSWVVEHRLEWLDFNGHSIGGKMEMRIEKHALNNFKAYGWQKWKT